MTSLIQTTINKCSCGEEKVIEDLYNLDTIIANKSFDLLKSTFFDLKKKISQQEIFNLIHKRNFLIKSINVICRNSNLKLHLGIPIEKIPCQYN